MAIQGPKGGYATIRPPFYKGYILIETDDGKTYKYVRNQVRNLINASYAGDSGNYYTWGDTRNGFGQPINGDSYNNTGDTVGRIKFDYERIILLWQTQLLAGANALLKFPELAGDTALLTRRNKEQLVGTNIASDSYSYRFYNINPVTRTKIIASKVISISVIEERNPDWYQSVPRYNA